MATKEARSPGPLKAHGFLGSSICTCLSQKSPKMTTSPLVTNNRKPRSLDLHAVETSALRLTYQPRRPPHPEPGTWIKPPQGGGGSLEGLFFAPPVVRSLGLPRRGDRGDRSPVLIGNFVLWGPLLTTWFAPGWNGLLLGLDGHVTVPMQDRVPTRPPVTRRLPERPLGPQC